MIALWRRCGLIRPVNDPRKDIARKKRVQRDLFLVAERDGAIVGALMGGYDGHRGWVYYVGSDPDHRGEGIGRALMEAIELRMRALGCPKLNLSVLRVNLDVIGFYERLGYKEDPVTSLGKRLERDEP